MTTIITVNIRCDGCGEDAGHTVKLHGHPTTLEALAEVSEFGWVRIGKPVRDYCNPCAVVRGLAEPIEVAS